MSAQTPESIRNELHTLQLMIDISAGRLKGLRTECEPSAELTQQEIRTVEGKLIKLFSNQLLLNDKLVKLENSGSKNKTFSIRRLEQWLSIVGLPEESVHSISRKVSTLEALQDRTDHELRHLLPKSASEEQIRKLSRALHNLRKFTDILRRDDKAAENCDPQLHWDSWDNAQASPRLARQRWNADVAQCYNNNHVTPDATDYTRRDSRSVGDILTKSRSHDSQFLEANGDVNASAGTSGVPHGGQRARLPTEPGPNLASPLKSPPLLHDPDRNVLLPNSPRTPTLARTTAHRFTKTFKVMTMCNYCEKQMFIGTGLKCLDCQYICHRDCEIKLETWSLESVDGGVLYKTEMPGGVLSSRPKLIKGCRARRRTNHSPRTTRPAMSPRHKPIRYTRPRKASTSQASITIPPFSEIQHGSTEGGRRSLNVLRNEEEDAGPSEQEDDVGCFCQPIVEIVSSEQGFEQGLDSSSTSSCNSSAPSSPALLLPNMDNPEFIYPDVRGVTLETHPIGHSKMVDLVGSRDSDKTISVSESFSHSTDSDKTPVRVDSQDSQVSDGEQERVFRQNSLSIREWDIPYDELNIGEMVGRGRFGTVYHGNWYGDVAVKVLDMDYLEDEKRLDAFKFEVATFRKTRHENVVLFMGACMKPQHFAIVTSFSKGMTLYTHIHLRHEKFYLNKNIGIALQIAQGMGYLHAKGIIHKDLKSKNIFLENGKVVITDFGLFGVTKLCYGSRQDRDGLMIPPGWLCYLSSEMMASLRSSYQPDEELPFSTSSDVYSFGTVWYEMLCGDWPFKGQPPESIIWQVGKGMKQSLANLQASRDVKDILMLCWSYRASDRPDFGKLFKTLEKLPKKKLARSPSHPIHLSRSAESVF